MRENGMEDLSDRNLQDAWLEAPNSLVYFESRKMESILISPTTIIDDYKSPYLFKLSYPVICFFTASHLALPHLPHFRQANIQEPGRR